MCNLKNLFHFQFQLFLHLYHFYIFLFYSFCIVRDKLNLYFEDYQNKAELSLIELQKKGIELISFSDKAYPFLYSKIPNPPIFLFVKGNLDSWSVYAGNPIKYLKSRKKK